MPNKIQFKRGLKASLPDLDAGEPGYCTDTQELFIGNSAGQNTRVGSTDTVTGIVNVKTGFGAIGDGVTDDWQAITNAISACPAGGQVYFPSPTSYYRCSLPIEITKPISIIGPGAKYPFSIGTEMIQFDSNCLYGFHVRSNDVRIDGLSILMKSVNVSTVGGIYLDTIDADPDGFMRNIHISNVDIMMNSGNGAGVHGVSVITSSFTNVKCQQGAYGFRFTSLFGTGTSVKFDSCWAINNVTAGYSLNGYFYCSFINCATDTGNAAAYGYVLSTCEDINFIGCGAEKFVRSGYSITSSTGITLSGCLVTAISAPNFSTFAELRGTTKNVVMSGCSDLSVSATFANVLKEATADNPIIMNCNFPNGYSTDGLIRPVPINKGYILLGTTLITDEGIVQGKVTALPTASAAYRGRTVRVEGGAGVADVTYQCLKSATDTYSWKTITTG